MPIGSYALVPHVAHALCQRQPQRILDLGIGFGIYGAVVRQWIDRARPPWRTYLVGVEAFASYGNPLWDLYNLIVIAPVQEFLAREHEPFDFIMFFDVIEHLERPDGIRALDHCQALLSPNGRLMVGTPAIFMEQDAVGGNEFERHRSLWTAQDFLERGWRIEKNGAPDAFGHQMILAEYQASAAVKH
jgi:predicted TPR repeat methyltransferase